jgi:hypothetical protein
MLVPMLENRSDVSLLGTPASTKISLKPDTHAVAEGSVTSKSGK